MRSEGVVCGGAVPSRRELDGSPPSVGTYKAEVGGEPEASNCVSARSASQPPPGCAEERLLP
jgi:hypothetical protein